MKSPKVRRPLFLGIEGGGTHTVAITVDADGKVVQRMETGPANYKLLDDVELEQHLRAIAGETMAPDVVAIGLAGTWSEQDSERIKHVAGRVWPGVPCRACSDLDTGLAAVGDSKAANRILVLSGTGSCCYAISAQGKGIKVGSGGHIVADIGSAYQISVEALRGVFARFENTGQWPSLGARLLAVRQFTQPDDLIGWAANAKKAEISSLAPEVVRAWESGDGIATRVILKAAAGLVAEAKVCMRRAGIPPLKAQFVLSGSMLIRQISYQKLVASKLKEICNGCKVVLLHRESAWGAVELAREMYYSTTLQKPCKAAPAPAGTFELRNLAPTERRNPRSMKLDRMPIGKAVELMLSEEAKVPEILSTRTKEIEKAIQIIVRSLRSGGRLFYVGAGTSGRLGVLDASECPPTFRTAPDLVQGIIAGGQSALWNSIEGAEDKRMEGTRAVVFRDVGRKDVVVGITASGTTPFVWGALDQARMEGASTVLISFNPKLTITGEHPDVVITADLGPEVLTGSTRLKAGTATKMLLNAFTTISMVRLGKVVSNLMVDLQPSNMKLKSRAVRIVSDIAGVEPSAAARALERSGWVVRDAIKVASRENGN